MQLSESTASVSKNLNESQFHGADASLGVSVIQQRKDGAENDFTGYMDTMKVYYKREGKDEGEVLYEEENRRFADIDLKGVSEVDFKFLVYQESTTSDVAVTFTYSFTQNQGLVNEKIITKSFSEVIKLKSQNPFKIEWQVKSEDPYLNSVKKKLANLMLNQEQANAINQSEVAQ